MPISSTMRFFAIVLPLRFRVKITEATVVRMRPFTFLHPLGASLIPSIFERFGTINRKAAGPGGPCSGLPYESHRLRSFGSEGFHVGGYSDGPRYGTPYACADGGFCDDVDAGHVPWRKQQSVAAQGNEGATARVALAAPAKEDAKKFADPCARFQGRGGT